MNRKILQKVIDELKNEQPKLDYIRGILETLIESLPEDHSKVDATLRGLTLSGSASPTVVYTPISTTGSNDIIDPVLALETGLSSRIKSLDKALLE